MKVRSPAWFAPRLLVLLWVVAAPAMAQDSPVPADFAVAASTRWEAPTHRITNLDEFFSTLPETEIKGSGVRRMATGVVSAVRPEEEGRILATFRLEILPEAPPVPRRSEVSLSLPLRDLGPPFVPGQSWTICFDGRGEIVQLQIEGTITHYRRRADGLVQVRFRDLEGRGVEILPTTLMAPEGEWEGGFFAYLGLFRKAGLVAGYSAVGGPSSVELESIRLPDLEGRRDGLLPDPAPWRAIDEGLRTAIPGHQRFAY